MPPESWFTTTNPVAPACKAWKCLPVWAFPQSLLTIGRAKKSIDLSKNTARLYFTSKKDLIVPRPSGKSIETTQWLHLKSFTALQKMLGSNFKPSWGDTTNSNDPPYLLWLMISFCFSASITLSGIWLQPMTLMEWVKEDPLYFSCQFHSLSWWSLASPGLCCIMSRGFATSTPRIVWREDFALKPNELLLSYQSSPSAKIMMKMMTIVQVCSSKTEQF